MKNAQDYLKKHGIIPFISFKDGSGHKVELVECSEDIITEKSGEEKEGMKFIVLEDKETKSFFTSSIDLISKLAGLNKGTIVSIQMKKRKDGKTGEFRSYYDMSVIGEATEDDIPTVEE